MLETFPHHISINFALARNRPVRLMQNIHSISCDYPVPSCIAILSPTEALDLV